VRETTYALVLASVLLACDATTVIDGGGTTTTTSSTGTPGGGGADASSSATGGQGGWLAAGGTGGTPMTPWENDCADTFFEVQMDGTAPVTLFDACPGDWGAQFHDGPTAHETTGGAPANVVSELYWMSCGPAWAPNLRLVTVSMMPGAAQIEGGLYQLDSDGPRQWDVDGGTMTLTLEEGVGGVIAGDYDATFSDANGPVGVHGAFRVCHVPLEALP
jgi:hypothetical protein